MKRKLYGFLKNRFEHRSIFQFIPVLLFLFFLCGSASAKDVTLSWDANSEPDLAGYKVYYKANSSGQPSGNYDFVIDVGNVTSKTIEDLDDSILYFFAVTAYDTSGLESDFSNEISTSDASNTPSTDPVVITMPDAGTTPYLMTQGYEPDSLALYAKGGSISEGFNWSLASGSVGSLSEITNERTVIYTSPSSIAGNSATATVVLKNNAGTVLGMQLITVYKAITVTNKPAANQTVYAGEAGEPFVVQGGDGSYTWTVLKNGGVVDLHSGPSYTFNPEGDGAAGTYTITVTDGNNFADSFYVDVIVNTTSNNNNNNNLPVTVPAGVVSGYIVDEYGAGISDADVTLVSPKQFAESIFSSSDGYFSFSNIPAVNKYNFIASKSGYVSTEFSSDDLISGNSQNNITLKNADTYISGQITIDGADFSGKPVEVTVSYIINDYGLLAGKTISSNGDFRIDFEKVMGVSGYILTAARPGEYGQISVGSLPQSGVIIDIDTTLVGDDVNALAGGSSRTVTVAKQPVSIVRVPFGSIAPSSGVTDINIDITTVTNINSSYTSGSGSLLYNIDMEYQDITTILTLPFKLSKVSPGDFESGKAIIYYADTIEELSSGTDIKQVSAYDIISVDYAGDGATGLVEFYLDSLTGSVFGVGSASTGNPSVGSISTQTPSGDGGGGGGCFIDTVAYDAFRLKRILGLFGFFVLIGGLICRIRKSEIS